MIEGTSEQILFSGRPACAGLGTELRRLRQRNYSKSRRKKGYEFLARKAMESENMISCSLDDRPGYALGPRRGRNVRAPMERLVGNAHLPVIYPVKAGTDQRHRDDLPHLREGETPRSTEAPHMRGWQALGGARRIWVIGNLQWFRCTGHPSALCPAPTWCAGRGHRAIMAPER